MNGPEGMRDGTIGTSGRHPLADRYLGLLQRGGARALKASLEGNSTAGGRPRRGKAELLERLRTEIAYVETLTGIRADKGEAARLVAIADSGLARLFADGPEAVLDNGMVAGLEAVIRSDGSRPVLFVKEGFVDLLAPSIGEYAARLSPIECAVRQVCRAVGRVNVPNTRLGYAGTAWSLGDGLVCTNWHVLEAIAEDPKREEGRFLGRMKGEVSVDFGHEIGTKDKGARYPVRGVRWVGPAPRPGQVHPDEEFRAAGLNFDGLDLAILELEPVTKKEFPPPLPTARADDPRLPAPLVQKGRDIYCVGFPGDGGGIVPDLYAQLFRGVAGYKRLAPGIILRAPEEVPGNPRKWVMTHDASTLGGNSGSLVADLASHPRTVLGLHFGGWHKRENWAHALEAATEELRPHLPTGLWAS